MLYTAIILAQLSGSTAQPPLQSATDCSNGGCTITGDFNHGVNRNIFAKCPTGYEFVMRSNGPACARDFVPPDWN